VGRRRAARESHASPHKSQFTLPKGFTAEEWQLEVDATDHVQVVRLATDPADLKGL
jgi:hypothetical protein